ncbi:MaoC family dehydratase [soil metagenome]
MSASPLLSNAAKEEVLPTRRHRVNQDLISRYAIVSGDHNPLHTDPAFAATTLFGRTIAHGMMTLAFVSGAMSVWAGPAWDTSGTMDVTFLAPVFPDDVVSIVGVVSASDHGERACSIKCTVGDRVVAVVETRVFMERGADHG